jgi:hypothetical protein
VGVIAFAPLDRLLGELHTWPMADPAKRRATYEDLLAVPEHLVAEILNGELVTQPRPAAPHAHATSSLGGELYGPFTRGKGGPGGWVILFEPELHLQGHVLVPDLAGWRRERMPEVPDTAAIELAPDWICEILWVRLPWNGTCLGHLTRRTGCKGLGMLPPAYRSA